MQYYTGNRETRKIANRGAKEKPGTRRLISLSAVLDTIHFAIQLVIQLVPATKMEYGGSKTRDLPIEIKLFTWFSNIENMYFYMQPNTIIIINNNTIIVIGYGRMLLPPFVIVIRNYDYVWLYISRCHRSLENGGEIIYLYRYNGTQFQRGEARILDKTSPNSIVNGWV